MANPLAGCVNSLQSSISLLNSSIATLDSGVNDFPRLGKVLQTTRVSNSLPSRIVPAFLSSTSAPGATPD